MGYHIILRARIILKEKYIHFLSQYPFHGLDSEFDKDTATEEERGFVDLWEWLGIGPLFYNYNVQNGFLEFEIQKKPHYHRGYLEDDYKRFMKKIIFPVSEKIVMCEIEHDDVFDRCDSYTEEEVKGWT
jgi:hypothetical protein